MSKQAMIPYYFPEEILVEIFHKLPVKSLGKCMCVCKAWSILIKTPSFVSSHVPKNSTTNDTNLFLLMTYVPERETKSECSLHFDDHEFSKYALLPHTPFVDVPHYIVGSCNGLLCLVRMVYHFSFDIQFILWNPIIKKCFRVPEPCFCSLPYKISIGFGFDSISGDDYKILKITKKDVLDKYVEVELYSFKTNSWKILAPPKYDLYADDDFMAFANGVVHWVAVERVNNQGHSRCKFLLLGFDMGLEVFKEIMLPECLSNLRDRNGQTPISVMPYGELSSIAVIVSVYDEFNIWVMKKYNMVETWTKMFNLGILGIGSVPRVLGFRKNGGLILSGRWFCMICRAMKSTILKFWE